VRERNYDQSQQRDLAAGMIQSCTAEQSAVVKAVLDALEKPPREAKCFYVYACGGCGKTWLLELLLAYVRGQGRIAAWRSLGSFRCGIC
jgi:predicted ATPase